MADSTKTPLPVGAGYGNSSVVVGIGFFFAFLMIGISWLQNKYTVYDTKQSEEFNTASRSVKPGLIASGIVSAWTWAATLLQSSTVAYTYGVAGPFWYAAGATVQILMFSILACKVKQNAPRCHTFLEIIKARYGAVAHLVFMLFAFVTNILVGSQLLLGGSAVVTSLTGMPVYAAIFLIPVGVCAYVILGGLRATFLCDYSHTLILMIIILYFMFNAYAISPLIGSPGEMYDLLKKAGTLRPIAGNKDGSYLTLKSNYGLVFGVIQLCSGSGTVFLDQAYWQRAIASRPSTAVRAYLLGGIAWFAIPFGFSTTLGLAAAALTDNPRFPTYPNVPTSGQISSGLAAAYAAETLLGQGGAVALLIVLFMAVTSCASAELIAVSSLLTFDVYKAYIQPKATPKQLIFVSHIMICVFGLTMAGFACIWNAASIDLGWLFLVMGLLIGGAVFPTAFAITWRKQSKAGAISGCLVGLAAGLTAWLTTAKQYYGEITVETTGLSYPTLAGNLAAIMTGLIVSVTVSLIRPANFDWEITRAINAVVIPGTAPDGAVTPPESSTPDLSDSGEKKGVAESPIESAPTNTTTHSRAPPHEAEKALPAHLAPTAASSSIPEDDPKTLRRAFKLACIASFVLTFVLDFLVPMPMFFSGYVFSKGFFTGWVVVSFIWVFCSSAISCFLPVWETRESFGRLVGRVVGDVRGGGKGRK
ncbi:Na+/solute symporter [Melanomma pulvis-pyrius CBS 109.77]|uniref:Na+/solute symporter n=1 Tax=Melanomma pulvis-pyrius CBS 109.77 TaxID=1314802 RepID=A0A6A6WZC9_9PLEO|nr:Na+/solute symporter [Melanomma pulvis-pyrius CBS 109.77]